MNTFNNFAHLPRRMIAAAQGWRRAISQTLSEDGLSDATALPLVTLLRDGDGIRQGELAERVGVENTALVRILDGLERGGLIARDADPSDGRAKLVSLTAAGRAAAQEAEILLSGTRGRLMEGADPADLAAMDRVLEVILGNLAKQRQRAPSAGTTTTAQDDQR